MQLVPGTMVDRWRVEAEIGRGGMARVYRVRHRTLDTVLALKVLSIGGAELRERLLREGRVQSRLDHPHVVAVRDVLDLPEGPGLLMDYVDGPSLDRWLLEERPSAEERERVFLEVLGAVEHAHAHGVVHRDLKPANVLMERRDGAWHARVTDFGLAKIAGGTEDEDDPQGVQSRTGRPMGTPAYMAPEQVRSAKHVDHRADVFALGCMLYEMMCGHRAFVGNDSLEVFNRVTQGRFVRPRELVRDLPPRLEAAVLGALALDPEERIPNCAALARVMDGSMPWRVDDAGAAQTSLGEAEPAGLAASRTPASAAPTMAPTSALDWNRPEGPTTALRPGTEPAPAPAPPAPSAPAPERRAAPVGWVAAGMIAAALVAAWLAAPPADAPPTATPNPPANAAPPTQASSPEQPVAAPVQTVSTPEAAPAVDAAASDAGVAPTRAATPTVRASRPSTPPSASPESAPNTGRVEVSGDATSVVLRSNGQSYAPGSVPAGVYRVEAAFGGPPVDAGTADVLAGQTVRLHCRAADLFCSSSR